MADRVNDSVQIMDSLHSVLSRDCPPDTKIDAAEDSSICGLRAEHHFD